MIKDICGWRKSSITSKHFKSYKVYVIYCYNNNESFIKIGKTFKEVKQRFSSKNKLPYYFFVLQELEFSSALACCECEDFLHKKYKQFKYKPCIKFQGHTECFSSELLNVL